MEVEEVRRRSKAGRARTPPPPATSTLLRSTPPAAEFSACAASGMRPDHSGVGASTR